MSSDLKSPNASSASPLAHRDKGVRIFTYPKLIFIFPTLVLSLLCWVGMLMSGDHTERPTKADPAAANAAHTARVQSNERAGIKGAVSGADFKSRQNMLGLIFLGVFAFNILVLTFDFPRFTILAIGLLLTTALFFLLWLGMVTDFLTPLVRLLDGVYVAANSGFYLMLSLILIFMYVIVFVTRWLDYWEFMPNEILHHHGPWSDLERFPTMNLKFDKEIPDVFEHMLFGAGRLVFHVANEQKAIILDNVLHINRKEEALKQIMSRLEVRVTTDQEVIQP
jgi:hypothetical protein